jgi:hypothetical protein
MARLSRHTSTTARGTFWIRIAIFTRFGATGMLNGNSSWQRAGKIFGHNWQSSYGGRQPPSGKTIRIRLGSKSVRWRMGGGQEPRRDFGHAGRTRLPGKSALHAVDVRSCGTGFSRNHSPCKSAPKRCHQQHLELADSDMIERVFWNTKNDIAG